MAASQSKSSSSQSQKSLALTDNRAVTVSGSGPANVLDVSNIESIGAGNSITIQTQGLQGADLVHLVESFGMAAQDALTQTQQQANAATQALSNVATAATGADTEAGRLVGKLAVPILIAVMFFAWISWRKHA